MSNEKERIAIQGEQIKSVCEKLDRIQGSLDNLKQTFVTREEFNPVKNIAFGLAGTVLVAVLSAILSYFVRTGFAR